MSPAPLVTSPSGLAPVPPAPAPVPSRRPHLLNALRSIIRADSDPARQTLFARVAEARPLVALLYRVHGRLSGSRAAALLVSSYGLAAFVRVTAEQPTARVVVVASHQNAKRQVERVVSWLAPTDCGYLRTKSAGAPRQLAVLLGHGASLARAIRIVGRVERRHGFLVGCRVASTLAWYARGYQLLSTQRPGAVLVSSDANPEEAGVLAAARALDVPQVFVSHAYPTPFSPRLDVSLSILEGEAAVEAHHAKGPLQGEVLLAGIEGDSAPLDASRLARPTPTVGIFPPKAFSWPTLAALIEECRQHYAAKAIVIRWHPSMLEPTRLATIVSDLSGIVETRADETLVDVARRCDWVIAGENSNVHLPVLKLGIPTIAFKGLGLYTDSRSDLYGFVAHGIVLPPVTSLRELSPTMASAFFSDAWAERFARYDASYLRSRSDIGADVKRAILHLMDARHRGATPS